MNNYRQGSVWLKPVKSVSGKYQETTKQIVEHSESGHHHVLESTKPFRVYSDKELYLRLYEPAKLVHQKTVNRHNDLVIAPGTYQVIHKREYDPFEKIMRKVMD